MYNIITDRYKKFVMRKFLFTRKPLCVCFMGKAESGTGERIHHGWSSWQKV